MAPMECRHRHRVAFGQGRRRRRRHGAPDGRRRGAARLDRRQSRTAASAPMSASIMAAIDRAWSEAGVAILVDLGGAETNSEMAIEMLPEDAARPRRDLQRAGRGGRGDGGDRSVRRVVARQRCGRRPRSCSVAMKIRRTDTEPTRAPARSALITNEVGLHARPSVKLTQLAKTLRQHDRARRSTRRSVDRRQEPREGDARQGAPGQRPCISAPRRRRADAAVTAWSIWSARFRRGEDARA